MTTFQFLRRLIMLRPLLYVGNALAWTVIYLIPIAPGLITQQFFDSLTGSDSLKIGTWGIIALLLAAALARVAMIYVGCITDVQYRFRMSMILRRNLLGHVLKQPGARAIPVSPGEAISYFRDDVDQTEEAVSWSVDVFGLTCFAIVSSYILLKIDVQMTLLVFLPLVLVVTVAQLATTRLQKYRAASRESTARVTGAISEMFGNVQAIQVAGAEDRVIERFRRFNEDRRKTMLKDKLLGETLDTVFTNSVNLGIGLILLLAGAKMRGGSFTVGDFSLFVYYLTFVTQVISNVGKFMTYFKQMTVALARMTELLQGAAAGVLTRRGKLVLAKGSRPAAEASDPAVAREPLRALEVTGLSYRFPDTGRGIENVGLRLEGGSFTVVTGAIGSGKTTLVRTLLGLLPKDEGTITWNGKPVEEPGTFFTPAQSAYSAQIPRLYSDTLRNNILLGHRDNDGELARAVHDSVMEYDVAHLQQGLETVVGPRGVKLSGGQMQRAAAARMLVREAELYVFDDVSSALDVETEQKLWERIFASRGNAACLVVSHRRAALAHADHIIVMKDGRIESEGTVDELLAASETFRELWYGDERGKDGRVQQD
ncbi:ABC transporter transmembrane domain-containing protein [Paenibacillus sacheonensis]|uniref:ATP-binding cassette domain-containing protein n=1 Tax=Paenibacillus sacheonensis TaxID=742054 RepID=A0A7X5C2G5_9BACL|nr:ABC transporter ATP-binding protein [Paenibacillus sacheonensis]MBM7567647.1 ATP-binding cassette subfamily B protein [Paenibacillus sacheonensis]NBC71250.1 ATP-binding cassette domain-containing protein [Paenibacillus sacheonensis]